MKLLKTCFVFGLLTTVSSAVAFDGSDSNPVVKDRARDLITGQDDENWSDLTVQFDGWSQLYDGYTKTPILFDPRKNDEVDDSDEYNTILEARKPRLYPSLFDAEKLDDDNPYQKEPSMTVLNLGVDDEIRKTSMSIYQPLSWMKKDFINDEVARDQTLEMFASVRGVALLTLSYLDKSVANGLATLQQQADLNANNYLLKQISWAASKMSNPKRSQIYIDTDEKIEACIEAFHNNGRTTSTTAELHQCDNEVCPVPTSDEGGGYRYCVCCAEQSTKLNRTLEDDDDNKFSLVKRVFFGTRGPDDAPPGGGKVGNPEFVNKVITAFREMYGDVEMEAEDGDNPATDGRIVTRYIAPKYDVKQRISLIRNGNPCPDQEEIACPLTGTAIDKGVHKAIIAILKKFPPDSNTTNEDMREMRKDWVEASLGKTLNARDFMNLVAMAGGTGTTKSANWRPEGRVKRFLDSFADASAVAVFKRMHLRFRSIVVNHLAMNQRASAADKQQLLDLADRVGSQLALAEADLGASFVAEQQLLAIAVEADRDAQARIASVAASNLNYLNYIATASGYSSWGRATQFCTGSNCNNVVSGGDSSDSPGGSPGGPTR